MNRQEIIYKLQTDPDFILNFIVDNNLPGLLKVLKAKGYTAGNDKAYAKQTLVSLLNYGDMNAVQQILDLTPYVDSAKNYTGGMKDYFSKQEDTSARFAPESSSTASFNLNAFLGSLGAGLTTYSQYIAAGGSVSGLPYTGVPQPQPKNYTWVWVLLGVLVVGVIVFAIVRKNKNG